VAIRTTQQRAAAVIFFKGIPEFGAIQEGLDVINDFKGMYLLFFLQVP